MSIDIINSDLRQSGEYSHLVEPFTGSMQSPHAPYKEEARQAVAYHIEKHSKAYIQMIIDHPELEEHFLHEHPNSHLVDDCSMTDKYLNRFSSALLKVIRIAEPLLSVNHQTGIIEFTNDTPLPIETQESINSIFVEHNLPSVFVTEIDNEVDGIGLPRSLNSVSYSGGRNSIQASRNGRATSHYLQIERCSTVPHTPIGGVQTGIKRRSEENSDISEYTGSMRRRLF